jgi:hypothetical protein
MKGVAIACFLALASISKTAGQTLQDNPENWKVLSAVFGNQLPSSLSSPQILAHARIPLDASVNQNGYRVLCASYITGQNLGGSIFYFARNYNRNY